MIKLGEGAGSADRPLMGHGGSPWEVTREAGARAKWPGEEGSRYRGPWGRGVPGVSQQSGCSWCFPLPPEAQVIGKNLGEEAKARNRMSGTLEVWS